MGISYSPIVHKSRANIDPRYPTCPMSGDILFRPTTHLSGVSVSKLSLCLGSFFLKEGSFISCPFADVSEPSTDVVLSRVVEKLYPEYVYFSELSSKLGICHIVVYVFIPDKCARLVCFKYARVEAIADFGVFFSFFVALFLIISINCFFYLFFFFNKIPFNSLLPNLSLSSMLTIGGWDISPIDYIQFKQLDRPAFSLTFLHKSYP